MSKREEEKAVEATKRVAEQAKSTADKQEAAAALQQIRQQETAQQFQESVNTSFIIGVEGDLKHDDRCSFFLFLYDY